LKSCDNETQGEGVSRVQRPSRYILGHFGVGENPIHQVATAPADSTAQMCHVNIRRNIVSLNRSNTVTTYM